MSITFLKANGSYDTKINQPEEKYEGIGWQEIKELAETPQSTTKLDAAFIIPVVTRNMTGDATKLKKNAVSITCLQLMWMMATIA